MSAKVTINGHTYDVGPNDVVFVIGNNVHYNCKVVDQGQQNIPQVKVEGDLLNLNSVGDVYVTGNVQGNVDTGGAVTCGAVGGNINTNGKVECGTVGGNVNTNGAVDIIGDCGDIDTIGAVTVKGNCNGSIDTMSRVVVGSQDVED